ncbi:PTS sugar transporter subunit IIC [Breznakia pachnodae]|uniref:Permease IIC component n=1 Tax=Breznakia pachnodae TaxID=265178 RepID=A0ABU0E0C4_9FIRM|nr:PTS transporter subunit EIIC [Breznakia pachnodae]MDQ0360188.1 PTS system cellobiose-specific IIC component [Breznakia pachnodae]
MKNKDQMMEKVMTFASKVQTNKYLMSISNGLMGTLPIMMIGSVALLLAVLPVDFISEALASIGLTPYLMTAYTLTVGIIAVYAAFLIGYRLAVNFGKEGVNGGLVALMSFFILTPMVATENGSTLNMTMLGAQGLFTAMICGLVFARLYCLFIDMKLTIKMPDSVPPVVSNTFAGLFPAILTGVIAIIVALLFGLTSWGSFSDFVYAIISAPLTNLSGSVWSLVFIVLMQMVLWFFGLHGSLVVGGFITALYLPMDVANMDAVAAGVANSDLPNILGNTFYSLFSGIGGAGGTLSLLIVMLIFGKSKKHKTLAKLGIVPGCFTINEPIVFGLPMILNPIMAIPFITVPIIQTLVAYLAIASGIFPHLSGVQVPFGFPILANGFIAGGWMISLLQVICIGVGVLVYFPFFKMLDKKAVIEEDAVEEETVIEEEVVVETVGVRGEA